MTAWWSGLFLQGALFPGRLGCLQSHSVFTGWGRGGGLWTPVSTAFDCLQSLCFGFGRGRGLFFAFRAIMKRLKGSFKNVSTSLFKPLQWLPITPELKYQGLLGPARWLPPHTSGLCSHLRSAPQSYWPPFRPSRMLRPFLSSELSICSDFLQKQWLSNFF